MKFSAPQLETVRLVKLEHDLLELDHTIKSTLQLSAADPDKCISLLETYKGMHVKP